MAVESSFSAAAAIRLAGVSHSFVSAKDDGGDDTLVRPSDWNESHDILGHLDLPEVIVPSSPASGRVRLYAANGRVYSKDDEGNEYGPFDSGGGGERSAWDDATNYPLHADGDEFDYLSYSELTAVWSTRNVADSEVFCPGGSHIELELGATGDWIYKAVPSGDWEAVLEFAPGGSTNSNMFAIACLDTTGKGAAYTPNYDGNGYMWNIDNWVYQSTGPSLGSFGNYDGRRAVIVLRKNSTAFSARYSRDFSTFSSYSETVSPSFTPAYIAIGRAYSGGSVGAQRIYRLNFYSGTFSP